MKIPKNMIEYPSPLCNVCKIKNICHEMQKFVASNCMHFEGEPPEGYYQVDGVTCKFIENYNRGNKGYFIKAYGREWVSNSTFDWKIKDEQDRREYRKTHPVGRMG